MGIDAAVEPPVRIDLYQLRCAVAALVDCVNHGGLLNTAGLRRTEIAVKVLRSLPASQTGALRRAVDRLLSPADDAGSQRTIDAIAELAALTHVDVAAAPALAANLHPTSLPPHQGQLFNGRTRNGQPPPDPDLSFPRAASVDGADPDTGVLR